MAFDAGGGWDMKATFCCVCSPLHLYVSERPLRTENISDLVGMFSGCTSLLVSPRHISERLDIVKTEACKIDSFDVVRIGGLCYA